MNMYKKPKEVYSINHDIRYTSKTSCVIYLSTIKGFVFYKRFQCFRMVRLVDGKIDIINLNRNRHTYNEKPL